MVKKGFYGSKGENEVACMLGVVVATQTRGEVATILYSPDDQLYLVSRQLYEAVPVPVTRGGRVEEKYQYKDPLCIGDQVEFGIYEATRHVRWMQKSPPYLDVDYSGGMSKMDVIGVVGYLPEKGLQLWSNKCGYIAAKKSELEEVPIKNSPVWCRVQIVLDYGKYEGEESIPLSDFAPTYSFELVKIRKKKVSSYEADHALSKAPWMIKPETTEEAVRTSADDSAVTATASILADLQLEEHEEMMDGGVQIDEAVTNQVRLFLGL